METVRHTATRVARRQAITALGAYVGMSIALFGLPLVRDFSHAFIGSRDDGHADATLMIWFLAWWPHALRHGLDALRTSLVWAPRGVDLTWTTSIPGPSAIAAPLTLACGPVAAYNVLCLLAPPLAAWTAFLLCRHLTRAYWPSLAGGYFFGFSTYELAHLPGHLNLSLVFLVPLCVYLVVLRAEALIPPRLFVPALAAALVVQASISLEILATMTLFGGVAVLLASGLMPAPDRGRLWTTTGWTGLAYAAAGLGLTPYLYDLFRHGVPSGAAFPLTVYSADLANLVIPTPVTLLGHAVAARLTPHLAGNLKENAAYVGLPLLAVIGLFAARRWTSPGGRFLLCFLALVTAASLGPALHVAGRVAAPLPWRIVERLPLLDYAYPSRFVVYASFVIAVMAALWAADPRTAERPKWLLIGLCVVSLWPNLGSSNWLVADDRVPFFDDALYRRYLSPGENVLIIPYGAAGNGMLWQAESGMYFRMPEGYVGPAVPPSFLRWPIVFTFLYGRVLPDSPSQLRRFLAAHGVSTLVVGPAGGKRPPQVGALHSGGRTQILAPPRPDPAWVDRVFSSLGVPPLELGGVKVYRIPAGVARKVQAGDAGDVSEEASVAEFAALLSAAHGYLGRGLDVREMTPLAAEREGLLPSYWGSAMRAGAAAGDGGQYLTANGLWLSPGPDDTVAVGVAGPFPSLAPLIARYAPRARRIYFPAPHPWSGRPTAGRGLLLMLFPRAELAQLAPE